MADNEKPAAVTGTTAAVKTMADDTLRITIDIEPRHAQAAFAMFGMRGTPVAVARLTPEAAVAESQPNPEPEDYGKHYEVLYRAGWWFNPRVRKAFDAEKMEPHAVADFIKQRIYDELQVQSLKEIEPHFFIQLCQALRIDDTIPRLFSEVT